MQTSCILSGYNYTSVSYVFNLLACYAFEYCTPAYNSQRYGYIHTYIASYYSCFKVLFICKILVLSQPYSSLLFIKQLYRLAVQCKMSKMNITHQLLGILLFVIILQYCGKFQITHTHMQSVFNLQIAMQLHSYA